MALKVSNKAGLIQQVWTVTEKMRGKSFYISRENWYLENVTIDLVADADASVQYDGVLTANSIHTSLSIKVTQRSSYSPTSQLNWCLKGFYTADVCVLSLSHKNPFSILFHFPFMFYQHITVQFVWHHATAPFSAFCLNLLISKHYYSSITWKLNVLDTVKLEVL